MTLFKLSLRGAGRQAKDYLVYFVTVVMAAALLYSFNSLVFSREIRVLSQGLEMLPVMILLADLVVVGVFGWLVAYATRFMLLRRSRELGTYLLIGLENRQVARLFFLENLAVGGFALGLGTVLGMLLYQAFRAVILALFGMPYHFSFGFSLPAAGLTAVSFALIYLHALRRSRRYIRRVKIHELIYSDRHNEDAAIHTGKWRRRIFSASLVLGAAGTLLLMAGDALMGIIGAACVLLFLFGFFLSFASGVPAYFDRRPALKYRGQNLLIFRTLTAKLSTMGALMGVISTIFTATLISEGTGLVFRCLFQGRAAEISCFDLYISIAEERRNHDAYLDFIEENIPVEKSVLYPVYLSGSSQVLNYLTSCTAYSLDFDQDPILCYSDYAALRSIAGYRTAELEPGQYLIHCMTYLEDPMKQYTGLLTLGDFTLTPGTVYTEHFHQNYIEANGRGYILVVPDEAAKGLPVHHKAYAAKTVRPVSPEQHVALENLHNGIADWTEPQDSITAKANEEASVASQTALSVFPLYYLALALTMTAATILTIQQLSESEQYKRQFRLLHKLGMDHREMCRALRVQFTFYYAMPAVPSVLIGVPFILNLCKTPEPGIMVGSSSPAAIIGAALGIFFLIYGIYITLAYTGLKRNVLPEAD